MPNACPICSGTHEHAHSAVWTAPDGRVPKGSTPYGELFEAWAREAPPARDPADRAGHPEAQCGLHLGGPLGGQPEFQLEARLQADRAAVVELFSLLLQNAPEVLPPHWAAVADVVTAHRRFWVYPSPQAGLVDDDDALPFLPYVDRERLLAEWTALLGHARVVQSSAQVCQSFAVVQGDPLEGVGLQPYV